MKRTKGTNETSYDDNDMIKIALEIFRTDSFLAINKKLIKVLGLEKALFISNLIDKYKYFQKREMLTEDGAFYNTHEDQIYEIGLTEYQIRKCKKELIKMGILKTEKRGVPAKEFYFINFQLLIAMVFGGELNIEGLDLTKTEGLDLTKTEGLDLTKTEGLYNKTKDNKTKDNKNLFSDLNSKIKGKQDKNSRYVPLAKQLAFIVRSHKRINVTAQKIASWANEIRKLVETDGVSIQRVETALDWYEENIGDQYVPVIESGSSLRSKFIKLEDAMRRVEDAMRRAGAVPGQSKTISTPKDPKKMLQRFFRSKDLANVFYRDCYEPAEALFEGIVDGGTLAETLLHLYSQIKEKQEQYLKGDLVRLLPGPMELIARYIDWIRDNTWITNIRLDMFDLNHSLFSRFRRDEAKTDNLERDAITGKSYLRG
jgi:hypothetical protein